MSKVKQLADELYNQKVLDGWKNVSMETCLKRATDYYRMDKLVKKLTIPVVSQQRELLIAELNKTDLEYIHQQGCTDILAEDPLRAINCG